MLKLGANDCKASVVAEKDAIRSLVTPPAEVKFPAATTFPLSRVMDSTTLFRSGFQLSKVLLLRSMAARRPLGCPFTWVKLPPTNNLPLLITMASTGPSKVMDKAGSTWPPEVM